MFSQDLTVPITAVLKRYLMTYGKLASGRGENVTDSV